MNAEPQPPGGLRPSRLRAVRAAWCPAMAGMALAATAVICLAVDVISPEQAIAIVLPAILLIIAGLITAAQRDPAAGQQRGFRAGFLAGSLLRRSRSIWSRDRGPGDS